jgi:uncharacterized protein YndB with AHSA1/START domain
MPDIYHQFIVKAPTQKVFDAFCVPKHLNQWWPLRSTGKPESNERYNFFFGEEYDWYAQVKEVQAGKSLTWHMQDVMEDWKDTEVGFTLTETETGTKVDFFHKHWKEANDHYCISNFCWGQLLQGMKDYVESGKVIPFEKRN